MGVATRLRVALGAYVWAEALMPDARRVELFSRRSRPGWTTWGREAGKFDDEEA